MGKITFIYLAYYLCTLFSYISGMLNKWMYLYTLLRYINDYIYSNDIYLNINWFSVIAEKIMKFTLILNIYRIYRSIMNISHIYQLISSHSFMCNKKKKKKFIEYNIILIKSQFKISLFLMIITYKTTLYLLK